jgi:hypothetical protein
MLGTYFIVLPLTSAYTTQTVMSRLAMAAHASVEPRTLLQRMHAAQNQLDLATFVSCFAPDYQSEQPLHQGVAVGSRDQVHKNWAAIFGGVPDFQSELLAFAIDDETVWAEWHWYGTRRDGNPLSGGLRSSACSRDGSPGAAYTWTLCRIQT